MKNEDQRIKLLETNIPKLLHNCLNKKMFLAYKLIKVGEKYKKIPVDLANFKYLKDWNNKKNQSTYYEVIEVVKKGKADGIGIVTNDDNPIVIIDIDNCIDHVGIPVKSATHSI